MQRAEFASLEELARSLGASVSTIRRDLTVLEAGGNIRRTHGGARLISPRSDEFVFSTRDTHELAEKEAMGRLCVGLLQPRQTVIVDAGTTAYHVARNLGDQTLQIVTNSLPVANLFAASQRVEVVLSGGVIYPRLGVLVGPLAMEAFSRAHADVAIMSAGGITLDGVTNSHALLIEIQRAMIRAAGRVIFCLDHTKFGRQSVAHLCGLDSIDTIVTDDAAPVDLVEALRGRGVEVLIAAQTEPLRIAKPEAPTPAAAPPKSPAPSVRRSRRRVKPRKAPVAPRTASVPTPASGPSAPGRSEAEAGVPEDRMQAETELAGRRSDAVEPEIARPDDDLGSDVSWD